MNKKLVFISLLVVVMLLPTTTALAYYATVTGELRDNATNDLWTWGASVEVFNCNTLATINTATVTAGNSTFSIDVSGVSVATPLCIEVAFAPGPNGTPGNASKGPYPDRSGNTGTLNTGVYFTGTGPTAITLRDLSAESNTPWSLISAAAVVLVAMLALGFTLRRRAANVQ